MNAVQFWPGILYHILIGFTFCYQLMSFHNETNNLSLGIVSGFNGNLVTLEVTGNDAKSTFPSNLPGESITNLKNLRNVAEDDIKGRYVVELDPRYYINRELWSGSQNCRLAIAQFA